MIWYKQIICTTAATRGSKCNKKRHKNPSVVSFFVGDPVHTYPISVGNLIYLKYKLMFVVKRTHNEQLHT